jgi:hypothetical protein
MAAPLGFRFTEGKQGYSKCPMDAAGSFQADAEAPIRMTPYRGD